MSGGAVTSRLSQRTAVKALLDDGFLWEAAARLDALAAETADPTRGGRPRRYPLVCALIWDALVSVFGSARQVEVELACADSAWWDLMRRAAVRNAGILLPKDPMRRHHYRYLRDRYLAANDAQLDTLSRVFVNHAAELAQRIGLCVSEGPGSITHPSANQVIAGDGKVVTPRYRTNPKDPVVVDTDTGEIRTKRYDPDAGMHVVGGGDQAFGTKYVLLSTRGDARNQRVILAVAHSPTKGAGEAHTAIKALDTVLPELPGAQGVIYDGALRGTHLHRLITNHGIIPIARVHKTKGGKVRDEYLEDVPVTGNTQGLTRIGIHVVDGEAHARQIAVDGTLHLHPLTRTKLARRRNRDRWRLYGEYRLPEQLGAGRIRLRLDRTAEDIAAGFNREELLRPIPPGDPDHDGLYGRRSDTESGNRLLDDSMLRERAHTVGWRRQLVNLTTWAALRNASAAHQHAPPATGEPPAQAA